MHKINIDKWHKETNRPYIEEAISLLKDGQVVAFPTETVYGLGADACNSQAVGRIFKAKGRPSDNPLIVHVHNLGQAIELINEEKFDQRLEDRLRKLASHFWPGPLTCVVPASNRIAANVTAGLDTVGIRIPNHAVALALLQEANIPIAAPSANASGKPSPTTAEHVYHDLQGRIPLILDGGRTGVGVESTVIDIGAHIPIILRPGGISKEQLQSVLGQVAIDPAIDIHHSSEAPRSPGMKYAHYAPNGQVFVFFSDSAHKVVENMENLPKDETIGIICTEATYDTVFLPHADRISFVVTHRANPEQVASHLYQWLRDVDQQDIQHIFVEAIEAEGLGYAIMNRFVKASGGKTI